MSPWLRVQPEAIPSELRALPWVLWRAEPRATSSAKVPYRVAYPARRASSIDSSTWATFEDAVEAYLSLVELPPDPARGPVAGIGVVLTATGGVTCVDLDRVIGGGDELDPRAERIVERCQSWTEISPSGRGVHVFVSGRVARAIKGEQIEVYSAARFICVTGHQWPGTPLHLSVQQAYLDCLVRIDSQNQMPARPYSGPTTPPPDDLAGALLAKLQAWGLPVARLKRWADGFLVELAACPWADEHSTGRGGAAVMIHASGALDFRCQHQHCAGRRWLDFRGAMERR